MKIVADENIPCVEQAFASLGEVELLPGRGMRPEQVCDADILLVRSVTRVDEALLADSNVRFVGSATIGFDHIDLKYLKSRNIGFSRAPGSNAVSASEYIISVLMALSGQDGFDLSGKTVGIIGCGNVGSRVLGKLSALGVRCLVNDPPLKAQGSHENFVELEAVLQADIITVHVPLVSGGDFPTFHLLDTVFLKKLKPGSILINTSRGAVADNAALDRLLEQRSDLSVVLDVWEDEPEISMSLLEKVTLGTPHIAGYSLDGKLRGTEIIYSAACEYFQHASQWGAVNELPVSPPVGTELFGIGDVVGVVRKAVLDCYDVREDDERLRGILLLSAEDRPAYFDRLRKEYPVRREFQTKNIASAGLEEASKTVLQGLGFKFQ